jgi:aminodeoxyfutalosine deaminase
MDELRHRVARLPKLHLHCHLEGTLRAQTFVELADRYGFSTRYRPGEELDGPRDPAEVYRFANFTEFLMIFAAVSRSLARTEDYARLAREFVRDALAQNVVYGEIFISPSVWTFFHRDLDVREAVQAIVDELRAARDAGGDFALIVDLTRNFGSEMAMRTARLAVSLADHGVVGIGLGGDEARFPAELFGEAFAYARSEGLHTVAHAGEANGAQSVRAAIEIGAERIGHGIRAIEDDEVVALLKRNAVALEICPTSNYLTGVVSREHAHPFSQLDAHGIVITIDADDPALFGTTITDEYLYVAERAGIATLARFIAQAVDASFLDSFSKRALHDRIGAELSLAGAK